MKMSPPLGIAAVLLTAVTLVPLAAEPVGAAPSGVVAGPGAVTVTKTVGRSYLDDRGTSHSMDSRTIELTVSQTKELQGRQNIDVSWTGAHPTGGLVGDLNGVNAGNQEYPMVLLECRGTAATVTPETCWTHGPGSRFTTINSTPYGPWRFDRFATTPERDFVVGRPADTSGCPGAAAAERWVPFRAVDGKVYPYGSQGCAGMPPEDYTFDSSARVQPPNATFAPTGKDGSGSTKFNVWTDAENASLGCTSTVRCSLVAIPVMGISCDMYGRSPVAGDLPASYLPPRRDLDQASAQCTSTGNYAVGELGDSTKGSARAVTGNLWWSESNWRNRITVPLSLAPVSKACEQTGGGEPSAVYGSELMTEATAQWAPYFCLDPRLFKLTHVQTGEPLSRQLLGDPLSGVHAAFSGQLSTGFTRPTVQAPVAMTGFSISYTIDNDEGAAVTNLRMTPRLLAKMITESYPGDDFDRFRTGQYPYLKNNPVNVTADPEFQALNPGIHSANGLSGPAALIMLNSESDVTSALTSYIDADPEARAWLDGKADPWGMVVNPAYKGIGLPVLRWPLLDRTVPYLGDSVTCTRTDPAPWLPLVASPLSNLAAISVAVQFAASPGKTGCGMLGDPGTSPEDLVQWVSFGRMQPGVRFVIGVTSLGEARRYSMQSAALQSHADNPGARFASGAGRTFVYPTDASLRAGADLVRTDAGARSWALPAQALRKDTAAYPGTMPVYADVPTQGLSKSDGRRYAQFLRFAGGTGQTSGTGYGQLPAGYLPMTAANGLGALAAYTDRAADAVEAQDGAVPPLVAPRGDTGGTTSSGSGSANGGGPRSGNGRNGGNGSGNGATGPAGTGGGGGTPGGTSPSASPSGSAKTSGGSSAPGTQPDTKPAAQTVPTPETGLGVATALVPVLLGLLVLSGLLAGVARIAPGLRRKP